MKEITFGNKSYCPSKLICVGRNYAAHAKELGNPVPEAMVLFIKPHSALSDDLLSFHEEPLHYELELCFLVDGGKYSGVGLGIDLTKRALQSRLKEAGLPWERAKGFDGAAVLSNLIALPTDLSTLHFDLHIDGELRQHGYVKDMMYSPEKILAEVSSFMTLEDGDIIMTGTPKGVGEIEKGARFSARLFDGDFCLLEQDWTAQ